MTTRRQFLTAAAWTLPAIAVAVGTPALAASTDPAPPVFCIPSGTYTITPDAVTVFYNTAPDMYELQIDYTDGTRAVYGTNYGTPPPAGTTTWTVPLTGKPARVKAHLHNDCYPQGNTND